MAGYRTEQKKMLLAYLQAHGDEAYTVEELAEGMRGIYGELSPGVSTVYRLMTRLAEEGRVKRFPKSHGRGFVYQIVAGRSCAAHLHMKCTDCGRLVHLDFALSEELSRRIMAVSQFALSEEETVLFGVCAECQKQSS